MPIGIHNWKGFGKSLAQAIIYFHDLISDK